MPGCRGCELVSWPPGRRTRHQAVGRRPHHNARTTGGGGALCSPDPSSRAASGSQDGSVKCPPSSQSLVQLAQCSASDGARDGGVGGAMYIKKTGRQAPSDIRNDNDITSTHCPARSGCYHHWSRGHDTRSPQTELKIFRVIFSGSGKIHLHTEVRVQADILFQLKSEFSTEGPNR